MRSLKDLLYGASILGTSVFTTVWHITRYSHVPRRGRPGAEKLCSITSRLIWRRFAITLCLSQPCSVHCHQLPRCNNEYHSNADHCNNNSSNFPAHRFSEINFQEIKVSTLLLMPYCKWVVDKDDKMMIKHPVE